MKVSFINIPGYFQNIEICNQRLLKCICIRIRQFFKMIKYLHEVDK